jgi:hypothetical protein
MKVKSVLFSLLAVVAFVAFVSVGSARATLGWLDWPTTWFKVKVSETGKIAPVLPLGGSVEKNNEKTTTTYLLVDTLDVTGTTYGVVYCTFDGSVWTRNSGEWPILGGEPENFLTFFDFTYVDAPASVQEYWIPLEIKGKEKSNTAGEISSASFKNLGGVFYEVRVAERGVGSVKFTGSFITPDKVTDQVPPGCRIP